MTDKERIAELENELAKAVLEIREQHAQYELAPGMECICPWCNPEEELT